MPTKIITDKKFLPTKNFTISKIFWNLFRVFIFTQMAQKYITSSVRLNIWPTVNTNARCKIQLKKEAWTRSNEKNRWHKLVWRRRLSYVHKKKDWLKSLMIQMSYQIQDTRDANSNVK